MLFGRHNATCKNAPWRRMKQPQWKVTMMSVLQKQRDASGNRTEHRPISVRRTLRMHIMQSSPRCHALVMILILAQGCVAAIEDGSMQCPSQATQAIFHGSADPGDVRLPATAPSPIGAIESSAGTL